MRSGSAPQPRRRCWRARIASADVGALYGKRSSVGGDCEIVPDPSYLGSGWPLVQAPDTYDTLPPVITGPSPPTASFGTVLHSDSNHYLTVTEPATGRACVAYHYASNVANNPVLAVAASCV